MAFKMNGMGFGEGTGIPDAESMYNKKASSAYQKNPLFGKATWSADKTQKTRTGINLFGQKREVTKHFDPETGKKLGKEVRVTKKDGTKKMYGPGLFQGPSGKQDVKVKTVNPGLSKSGGIGKLRQEKGYFDKAPAPSTNGAGKGKGKLARPDFAASKPELKEFVSKDKKTGENKLKTYNQAWDKHFKKKDGMRVDKFGNKYADTEAGKKKFVEASKSYWAKMAKKKKNPDLLIDSQTGKKQK